jgi:anti-sigma B factor antagonist
MEDPPAVEILPPAPPYVAVVLLRGEHDLATRDAIGAALEPLEGDVLVDLTECTFIDSSVIGALLACAQRLRGAGHRLELVVPSDNEAIVRVLEIVDIASLVTVHERRP